METSVSRPLHCGRLAVWRGVGVLLAALSVIAVVSAATSAASPTGCRVRDVDAGTRFVVLQEAVDAAAAGDHLIVKGTCHGWTEVRKDLTISGRTTEQSGVPTLDADQRGTVLAIAKGITAKVTSLTIQDGKTALDGGGIANRGRLTLRDVVVRGSAAENGGGIWNGPRGSLVLAGDTRIIQNTAVTSGGGVSNEGVLVLTDSATVSRDQAGAGGGIVNSGGLPEVSGRVSMSGSSRISGNTATEGGGVWNSTWGILTMADSASITGNAAARSGGGVFNAGGPVTVLSQLTMRGTSAISANAARYGGGVYNGGDLTMADDSRISANDAERGAGVYCQHDLTMTGSSVIRGNTALEPGGGLYVYDDSESVLRGVDCGPGAGANIRDNTPDDCSIDSH